MLFLIFIPFVLLLCFMGWLIYLAEKENQEEIARIDRAYGAYSKACDSHLENLKQVESDRGCDTYGFKELIESDKYAFKRLSKIDKVEVGGVLVEQLYSDYDKDYRRDITKLYIVFGFTYPNGTSETVEARVLSYTRLAGLDHEIPELLHWLLRQKLSKD